MKVMTYRVQKHLKNIAKILDKLEINRKTETICLLLKSMKVREDEYNDIDDEFYNIKNEVLILKLC